MSLVNNLVITKKGALLLDLLKVSNGTFTKLVIGEGYCYDDLRNVEAVINPVSDVNIKSYEKIKENGIVKIYAEFDNTLADKDFWYRELGLMALDPDTGEEILYAYGNANELAEYIPLAKTDKATIRKSLILSISVANTDNVTVIIDSRYDSYQIKSEKGQPQGYASLDKNGLVPKQQLPVTDFVKGCVNSGPVDDNGEPAILSYDETTRTITVNAPFVYTTYSGKTYECTENLTAVINENLTGTVRFWVDKNADGEYFVEPLTNNSFIQKSEPQNAVENDIWVNNSVAPEVEKRKTAEGWQIYNGVEIGSLSIIIEKTTL